jgi:type II secretory pathway pseudopilin PulG
MLIVVAIVGLIAGISFPAVSSGVDSLRLASGADGIVSFLNGALNRAERRQEPMEITISPKENAMWVRSVEPGFERRVEMPSGVTIEAVLPKLPEEPEGGLRRIVIMPGGTAPRIGIQIANRKGTRRVVRVDPITGVPRVEMVEEK